MPRPKILPENRIRAYRACDPCKTSKVRCDSNLPCANCIKRGRTSHCAYHAASAARQTRRRHSVEQNVSPRPQPLSPAMTTNATDGRRLSLADGRAPASDSIAGQRSVPTSLSEGSPLRLESSSEETTARNVHDVAEDQDSPQEHFVTGPNGETLYIGENASLSFLDFLRHSLRQLVGATAFTEGQPQNLMLEPDVDQVASASISLSTNEKRNLFHSYSAVSSGILHLFSPEEVETLLDSDSDRPPSENRRDDFAAMDTALAIGAQARATGPLDAQYANTYFTRARAIAFENMLANPSVSIVRLFVLLSFFTLGACRQIPASIYLGIASKAAVVLGLHQPMSRKVMHQGNDYRLRLRIWHSLCILDVLTSSLLGRPCTVPRATRHKIQSLPLDADQSAFNAMLKGAAILDDICRVLNRGVIINVSAAQDLLASLRQWCRDLPTGLRRFASTDTSSALSYSEQQALVGSIHVSSIYYFAVILVTRPFLIQDLMSRIRQRSGLRSQASVGPGETTLAQVCITSAVYMGQLCRDISSMLSISGLTLGTLSLFKAWSFGSGLVLGFSMFAGDPRPDLNEAFSGVIRFLNMSGESNPQSRLYSETLKAFSDTISLYQRMASFNSARAAEQFIEQIFTVNSSQPLPPWPQVDTESSQQVAALPDWDDIFVSNDLEGAENICFLGHIGNNALSPGYQDLNDFTMQFSDNFAMDFRTGLL